MKAHAISPGIDYRWTTAETTSAMIFVAGATAFFLSFTRLLFSWTSLAITFRRRGSALRRLHVELHFGPGIR